MSPGGQVIGVAEHGVSHGAESRCQSEVFGSLAAKREDELSRVLADVLDVVKRTGIDVEHLSGVDREAGESAVAVEHRHQRGTRYAVGEFVAIACQCGVRIAPGLMTIRLTDMPLRIPKVSAVTRLIDPSSFSSTTSPSISEVACCVVMTEASAEIRHHARETTRTVRQLSSRGEVPGASMDLSAGIRSRRSS